MSISKMLGYLGQASLISMLLIFTAQQFIDIFQYKSFIIGSILFFVILTFLLYLFAIRISKSQQKGAFLSMVIFNVILKMVLSVLFVLIFVQTIQPQDSKAFIIPFLISYVVFIVFETMMLNKLAYK